MSNTQTVNKISMEVETSDAVLIFLNIFHLLFFQYKEKENRKLKRNTSKKLGFLRCLSFMDLSRIHVRECYLLSLLRIAYNSTVN